MTPNVADLRQETWLENVLDAAMFPDKFAYELAIPTVSVQEISGIYPFVPRGQMTRSEARLRAYGVPAPLTEFQVSRKRYTCDTIELGAPVYDDILNQTPDNLRPQLLAMTTQGLAFKIKLKLEQMFVAKFLQPNTWSGFAPNGVVQDVDVSSTNGGYSGGHLNAAGSNPELLINFAQRICRSRHGLEPKTLVMTEDVFAAIRNHPVIKDDIKYTQNALVLQNSEAAKNIIAQALGVDEIHVINTVAEQNAEGQPSQTGFLSSNCMLLMYKSGAPSLLNTSAAYLWKYVGDPNAVGGESGTVRSWYEAATRRRIYEASTAFSMDIISPDCGVFFKNVIDPTKGG